jgi:limonene-1,2-epoxide hydrolase
MSETRTATQVVEAFLDAYWSNNRDTALALAHDDFEWVNMPLPGLKRQGKEVLEKLFEGNRGSFPVPMEDGGHVFVSALEQGGLVLSERIDRMKFNGQWIEVPCNGHWEVVEGKVRLWRDYFDFQTYVRGMEAAGVPVMGMEQYY